MKNILFLDIDGVLTTRKDGFRFNDKCIDRLLSIATKTKAEVVIHSSWREDSLEKTVGQLPERVRPLIHGQTPFLPGKSKGEEIMSYLEKSSADNYVILDDEPEEFLPHQRKLHLVQTSLTEGLSDENVTMAEWILKERLT